MLLVVLYLEVFIVEGLRLVFDNFWFIFDNILVNFFVEIKLKFQLDICGCFDDYRYFVVVLIRWVVIDVIKVSVVKVLVVIIIG